MNIAYVVVKHIARGGGIEKYTDELGARMVARGHRVRVYSMGHYGPALSSHHGMEVVTVPCLPLPSCEKLSAGILATLHASVSSWPDVIHLHSVGPGAFGWLPRVCHKPAVVQFHGLEWKRSRWGRTGVQVLQALERMSVKTNRHYTAVSKVQCDYFRETYGIETVYIPGGAEVKTPPPAQELYALGLEPKRYVLFASRLVHEKGAHDLITAFRQLATTDKLVIAGDAPGAEVYQRTLRALAGDDNRILFPGFVEGRLLAELFSHARVYVQPSTIEGLSIALLEALSYGACCLVSDIPENIEAIDTHGVVFRTGDCADLTAKLRWLLAMDDQEARFKANAIAHASTHYSWDHIADQFEHYYQMMLEQYAVTRHWKEPVEE